MLFILIFMLSLIVIAFSVKLLFKIDVETAIFITFCSITLIIAFSALIGILQIGVYSGYLLSIIACGFLIVYFISNRSDIKRLATELFTPATVMFLIACFIYYIVIYDKVLIHDDEAGSWVREIKYMFTTGDLKKFSEHGNIISFFTLYCTKITGYSEGNILFSLWAFTWSVLILPVRRIKWKQWYKVLIYAIGSYCIVNLITSTPAYLMDTLLGVLSGVICVVWSSSDIKRKDFVWLYTGVFILVNLKDELGAVIALFTVVFCIICSIIRHYTKPESNRKIKIADIILSTVLLYIIIGFVFNSSLVLSISKTLHNSWIIYYSIFIAVVSLIIFLIIKNIKTIENFFIKHHKIIIASILLIVFLLSIASLYIIYSITPIDSWRRVELLLYRFWAENFFGTPAYMLISLSIVFVVIQSVLITNKKQKKSYIILNSMMIAMVLLYTLVLFMGYMVTTGEYFDHWMNSFSRYYGTVFILAAIWFLGKTLTLDIEFKYKNTSIISSLVVLCLLINQLPVIGNNALANLDAVRYDFTYNLRPDIANQADFISENAANDEKVLILCSTENNDWDPFTAIIWLRYELLPIDASGFIIVGDSEYKTTLNRNFTDSELKEYIEKHKIDYIYVYSKNISMIEKYKDIMEPANADRQILYKVTPNADYYLSVVCVY